jgi:hypothetical protein
MASQSFAGYDEGRINRYYVDSNGVAYVGLTVQPVGTCNYFGEYFRFDTTTPAGKSMFATLAAAKASDALVVVWYSEIPVPGSDQSSGCNGSNMAVLGAIGIN